MSTRQRLPKTRSQDWLMMAQATESAIKDLRYAYEILGVHARQLEGWNAENADSCGKVGDANLKLSRDYIISAVNHLRFGRKGVRT